MKEEKEIGNVIIRKRSVEDIWLIYGVGVFDSI